MVNAKVRSTCSRIFFTPYRWMDQNKFYLLFRSRKRVTRSYFVKVVSKNGEEAGFTYFILYILNQECKLKMTGDPDEQAAKPSGIVG